MNFGIELQKFVNYKLFGGGGSGMVIRLDVLGNTITFYLSKSQSAHIFFLPRGCNIDNNFVKRIILQRKIMFICGMRVTTI